MVDAKKPIKTFHENVLDRISDIGAFKSAGNSFFQVHRAVKVCSLARIIKLTILIDLAAPV